MTITDDILMAFADDELDQATRDAVAAAMRDDPAVAERVARHRALRATIQQGFAAELDEAPPERLLLAARAGTRPGATARTTVADPKIAPVAATVAAATASAARVEPVRVAPRLATWRRPLMAMAASLMLGVALGILVPRYSGSIVTKDGVLIAHGALARALSMQLGSEDTSDVKIGVSFLSKSGDYCRTFLIAGTRSPSGLACRRAAQWQIQVLQAAAGTGDGSATQYRTAGSSVSPVILGAIQQQIDGDPLDSQAEIAARQQDWLPPRR